METVSLRSYRLEFAKRAEGRREDLRHLDQIKQKQDDEKKEKREREADQQDALRDMTTMVLATQAEMADFTVQLDAYDAATVEALMENEEQLLLVRGELKTLLDKAYVMPDGRRVFKTEDGSRIFDERGDEVKDIDPDTIEDWRPHWEKYQNPFEREADLSKQREEIFEFQKLSDEVRAETKHAKENGGMSRERLEELKEKLADAAPDAVTIRMAKEEPKQDAELADGLKPQAAFRPAGKLDMPAL